MKEFFDKGHEPPKARGPGHLPGLSNG